MGGAIATLMTLSAPSRILSLTLLAPGGFGPEIAADVLRDFARTRTREEIMAAYRAMMANGAEPPRGEIESLLKERQKAGLPESLQEIAAAITRGGRQGEIPRPAIATMSCPVTIVWGIQDPVLPVRHADGLDGKFEIRLVDGAGHMLVHEAPGEVVRAILDTIDRAN
jgi:pyruvate dehydrogenase E2 component (dihydrolipoamide acetyltransferase)